MELDAFPLSMFLVDCDGSACGSGDTAPHTHPTQDGRKPLALVVFRNGQRIRYEEVQQGMNDKQREALTALCGRYNVAFDESHYVVNPFDLPSGYVAGWIGGEPGTLYVGCSPEGDISS